MIPTLKEQVDVAREAIDELQKENQTLRELLRKARRSVENDSMCQLCGNVSSCEEEECIDPNNLCDFKSRELLKEIDNSKLLEVDR